MSTATARRPAAVTSAMTLLQHHEPCQKPCKKSIGVSGIPTPLIRPARVQSSPQRTVSDPSGRLIRRVRRDPRGEEIVIIAEGDGADAALDQLVATVSPNGV